MAAFTIRNLTFFYPEQAVPALQAIDLTVEQGEFLVLCGASGSGKSTLLRQCKPALAPHGRRSGEILFDGAPLEALLEREQAARIGFIQQSPENQIVTDKVWHELAFGLESLGTDTPTIRRRVAEMASFFGIEPWFEQSTTALSGGQKQLVNLASVLAMQPQVLLLDEPTAQLDPIAAADFLQALGRVNRELGTTIILSEHRLEDALPLADRMAVLENGGLLAVGAVSEVGRTLQAQEHTLFAAMPTAMRVWAGLRDSGGAADETVPVTVRDGRRLLDAFAAENVLGALPPAPEPPQAVPVIEADEVHFAYEQNACDVLDSFSLSVQKGEFLTVLGGNGTGKSTAVKVLGGLLKPYRGQVKVNGRVGILPQDPQTLFLKKTVREDLRDILRERKLPKEEQSARITDIARLCGLSHLLDRHPYDLSGGEQQRAALAKVLLTEPDILLLDEPTKGFDPAYKQLFADIVYALLKKGVTVVAVSHDVEFCARYAQRCALFFNGQIIATDTPRRFFSGNSFYTTSANRMVRHLCPQAVTADDILCVCGQEAKATLHAAEWTKEASTATPETDTPIGLAATEPAAASPAAEPKRRPLPLWRKLIAGAAGIVAALLLIQILGICNLTALIGGGVLTPLAKNALLCGGLLIAALFIAFTALTRKAPPPVVVQTPVEQRALGKRTAAAAAMSLLLIPATLFIWLFYLGEERYLFISLVILLECMLPFFLLFESRKPQARELVILAVLCAVAVAGRTAFVMLPEFKPMLAVTIIAGVAFGGEAGFLVGALSMLVSNFVFSQGVFTPFQMFAAGLVGFLAGVLFRKGWLRRTRASLAVFGAAAALLLYGGLMNTAAALLWLTEWNLPALMVYYVSGLPMDCVHAAATAFFLWVGAEPMLEKLDRIKVKYGLLR